MKGAEIRCRRAHVLVRGEPFDCGKHVHLIFTCPMRVGSRACGDQVIVPPLSGTCGEEEP